MTETQKHVTVQAKYVSECVQCGLIILICVSTTSNCADFLIKPLGGQVFCSHRDVVMVYNHRPDANLEALMISTCGSDTRSVILS